jgi:hypothetical protein
MKTLLIFLLIGLSVTFLRAQTELNHEVRLNASLLSIKEIIQTIEEQTSFRFSHGSTVLLLEKVNFSGVLFTVEQILQRMRQQTRIGYKIKEHKIILIPADKKHTIRGYMRDASNGENLIGGNVYVPGRSSGTTTNAYGFYSVTLPADSTTLVFSYSGYDSKTVRLFPVTGHCSRC